MSNCFSKDLILINLKAASAEEAIRALSCRLEEHGCVKASFCDAVIEREKVFATGLPVEPMGVAIPHTDAEHVNHMAIALGVLSSPVKFGLMGGGGEVEVDLVFLMALDQLNRLLTDEKALQRLRLSCRRSTVMMLVKKFSQELMPESTVSIPG